MSGKRREIGAVGRRVASNIRHVRTEKRMTYTELSERLVQLGNPIPPLGLRRIEHYERRIDVDDLVATARAFGCNPLDLLGQIEVSTTITAVKGTTS